jgi:hypothetical protein
VIQVRRWLPLACATAMVACDQPMQPATPEIQPEYSFNLGPTALGLGNIDLTSANAGLAKLLFFATTLPNGSAVGHFYQYREVAGLTSEFWAKVECLSVDPVNRRAWLAGTIVKNNSTHPASQVDTLHMPGMDVWFRVVDYTQGFKQPQPDRSTVLGFRLSAGIVTSEEYCATRPWPDDDARTFPLASGNLKVSG